MDSVQIILIYIYKLLPDWIRKELKAEESISWKIMR